MTTLLATPARSVLFATRDSYAASKIDTAGLCRETRTFLEYDNYSQNGMPVYAPIDVTEDIDYGWNGDERRVMRQVDIQAARMAARSGACAVLLVERECYAMPDDSALYIVDDGFCISTIRKTY